MTTPPPDHVALLRAVNVAGANKVPMAELRDLFATLGFADARTYVQSGNVVFAAGTVARAELVETLEHALSKRFGYEADVIVRSNDELAAALAASPFAGSESDPTHVHIAFLGSRPSADSVTRLDPTVGPGEQFAVIGSEVHLSYGPNGSGRSKLIANYFMKAFGTPATARNLRSVRNILAMLQPTS